MRFPGSTAKAFTLIELLIVAAITGLLASVATAAYLNHVNDARTSKVVAHYSQAQKYIGARFLRARDEAAAGAAVPLPSSAVDWVQELNPSGDLAPGGGNAYVAGTGDPITGAVGVQSSRNLATGNAQVILTRPAYAGLLSNSITIDY